jgi:hypothetical protein
MEYECLGLRAKNARQRTPMCRYGNRQEKTALLDTLLSVLKRIFSELQITANQRFYCIKECDAGQISSLSR